jgi:tRNA pseudouridine55 synthase
MTNQMRQPSSTSEWEGVLPIWKAPGMTSHDVVAKVRRLLRMKRVGHTGTLDPAVPGVLPICLGRATRVVEYIQDLPKQYEAELTIGYRTDTEDATGNIVEQVERVILNESQIRRAIASFVGEIEQIPPMFSAVKSDGVRLYELARQGIEVERKPRKAIIHSVDIQTIDWTGPFPKIRFVVWCSKGTYIRTLCADIGKALGYPAVMSELTRTSTGRFTPDRCVTLEQLAEAVEAGRIEGLLVATDQAIEHLPKFTLHSEAVPLARNGRKLSLAQLNPRPEEDYTSARLYSGVDMVFIGIYRIDCTEQLAVPEKLFT